MYISLYWRVAKINRPRIVKLLNSLQHSLHFINDVGICLTPRWPEPEDTTTDVTKTIQVESVSSDKDVESPR